MIHDNIQGTIAYFPREAILLLLINQSRFIKYINLLLIRNNMHFMWSDIDKSCFNLKSF